MTQLAKCFDLLLLIILTTGSLSAQTGPPVIQSQPQNQNVLAGGTATFDVFAVGKNPLSYQWFRSTGIIPNATLSTLKLQGVDEIDSGPYFVIVTDPAGLSTRSSNAVLSVTRVDFGDAPAAYPTLLSADGARHRIVPGIHLGKGVSFEPDGQPD